MKMTYAYQKLNNLEPQTPVFQIELVKSKRLQIWSKLIIFLIEHNELTIKMTSAHQKFNDLEPQTPVFQLELVNSKRFKILFKLNKFSE